MSFPNELFLRIRIFFESFSFFFWASSSSASFMDFRRPILGTAGMGFASEDESSLSFAAFKNVPFRLTRLGVSAFRPRSGMETVVLGAFSLLSSSVFLSISKGFDEEEKCHERRFATLRAKLFPVELLEFELSELLEPKRRAKSRTDPLRRKAPSSSGFGVEFGFTDSVVSVVRECFRGRSRGALRSAERKLFICEKKATRSRRVDLPVMMLHIPVRIDN